jgi:predicted TIM-barrel enzyme
MPNPWTGKGNPYTREEVRERLRATLAKGDAIIAAGAGTGISAKFIEKGGADLIIIYNSGRFRMMGHGSTAGMMAYGDANAIAMEIGEYEVLPVVEEVPVICGVHATDPRRRMWHWLGQVKEMGFSGVNNFPTHTIVDGHFRGVLEETGMSVKKEYEMIALARRMDLFSASSGMIFSAHLTAASMRPSYLIQAGLAVNSLAIPHDARAAMAVMTAFINSVLATMATMMSFIENPFVFW